MNRRKMIRLVFSAWPLAIVTSPAQSCLAAVFRHPQSPPYFTLASLVFLRDLTREVVQAARVGIGETRNGAPLNTTGQILIMPGGNYPAFWIRDFAMSLDSGFITAPEILHHLRLTARCQNDSSAKLLKNGLIIPPFAIPDHILFNGKPSFYPGSFGTDDDQGNGTFGFLPPIDDHFEFIHMAHRYYLRTRDPQFLQETIGQIPLIDRLIKAFEVPTADPKTGLVSTSAINRAVGFGFCDSIYFTGNLLFPSLLRYRAAGQLIELCRASKYRQRTPEFSMERAKIARNLVPTFGDSSRLDGWLMAATEVGRQADVWGTLYALYLGALPKSAARRARQTIADSLAHFVFEGAVRHVPTNLDASPTSAWEKAACAHNTYQNGAYWHTPTGWLLSALFPLAPQLAGKVFEDYIQHLRQNDFRLGQPAKAPWECFGRNGHATQNGVYMTSVALPMPIIESLANAAR